MIKGSKKAEPVRVSPGTILANHQVDQRLAYRFLAGDLDTGLTTKQSEGLVQATEAVTGLRNTGVNAAQAMTSGTWVTSMKIFFEIIRKSSRVRLLLR